MLYHLVHAPPLWVDWYHSLFLFNLLVLRVVRFLCFRVGMFCAEVRYQEFLCQCWADIYQIIVETVCDGLGISNLPFIVHEFIMWLWTFLSIKNLFNDGPHFSKLFLLETISVSSFLTISLFLQFLYFEYYKMLDVCLRSGITNFYIWRYFTYKTFMLSY